MPEPLPPDLTRLGDALTRATERRAGVLRRRAERRGRIAATGVALLAAAALVAPLALPGGDRREDPPALTASTTVYRPVACDQPRGATFAAARPCASPGSTDVPPVLMARRYAVQ
jgi:hypothetical protein